MLFIARGPAAQRSLGLFLCFSALAGDFTAALTWDDFAKPQVPNLGGCPGTEHSVMPEWLVESIYESSPLEQDEIIRELEATAPKDGISHAARTDEALCDGIGLSTKSYLQSDPPNHRGEPSTIPTVWPAELSARAFHENFSRAGLPVVIKGLASNFSWWATHSARVSAAAERDYTWNAEMENSWCPSCASVAHELGKQRLREMFYFAAPLPELEGVDLDAQPNVLWTQGGGDFGGPGHFDWGCLSTLSIQYRGSKKWTLWAPWDLGPVKAHARLEAAVDESDAIFYPPAWFHQTKVLRGLSVSVAHFTLIPSYGSLANASFWQTPFEACATGDVGWRRRNQIWDEALRSKGDMIRSESTTEARSEL